MSPKSPVPRRISISKDTLSTLQAVKYGGSITVADTAEGVAKAVEALSAEKIVGFDTETRPSFMRGASHHTALMQISTHAHCYLIRVNKTGMTPELKAFIENGDILKIGLSLKDDFSVMHRTDDFKPAGFVDLQSMVQQYDIIDIGLSRIYAILFGQRISKGQRLTNWEASRLTPGQQAYAAIDAWACLKIYEHLLSGAFHPDESPYIMTAEQIENDPRLCSQKS